LGALTKVWVPHDVRDLVVDFVRYLSEKTEIGTGRFIHWLGYELASSTTGVNATGASWTIRWTSSDSHEQIIIPRNRATIKQLPGT
jgi:hypothetical protein